MCHRRTGRRRGAREYHSMVEYEKPLLLRPCLRNARAGGARTGYDNALSRPRASSTPRVHPIKDGRMLRRSNGNGPTLSAACVYYCSTHYKAVRVCGGGIVEEMCYERLRALTPRAELVDVENSRCFALAPCLAGTINTGCVPDGRTCRLSRAATRALWPRVG